MANKETKSEPKAKRVRRVRKAETVRERNAKASAKASKTGRLSKTKTGASNAVSKVGRGLKKEIYIPMPDNKFGRFLNKRRSFIPKYFKESWKEVKQVTWPNRKTTWQLTFAVFMFALIFGAIITIVDYGLDKVFRAVLVK